jgi:hypothetical protein
MMLDKPGRKLPKGHAASRVRGGTRQRCLPPTAPGTRSASGTGWRCPPQPFGGSSHQEYRYCVRSATYLSRSEYVRRRLAQDAATPGSPVSVGDLARFAGTFADLADPDVMSQAWTRPPG